MLQAPENKAKSTFSIIERQPRLSLRHVTRDYHNGSAVKDVSFDIHAGEVVCLLGPSGCGKSTTLRIAAGVERDHRGEVLIDGGIVAAPGTFVSPENRHVGLMFQDYALFPHLTVRENVTFGLRGLRKAERQERALELLTRVGLDDVAGSYPHTLSGGMQQRVALARAMAPEPKVILLDEPFSGLDRRLRDSIRDETIAVLRETGAAILLVTHDPEEAQRLADRIAVMREGRLIQIGTPDELYNNPVDAGVASFFNDLNLFHAKVTAGKTETPFGILETSSLNDGDRVEVMFRPQALALSHQGVKGEVIKSRKLGAENLFSVKVEGFDSGFAGEEVFEVRSQGAECPKIGDSVHLSVKSDEIFVFPCQKQAN